MIKSEKYTQAYFTYIRFKKVIDMFNENKKLTIADIEIKTKISHGTISKIIQQLLENKIIETSGIKIKFKGRSKLYKLKK